MRAALIEQRIPLPLPLLSIAMACQYHQCIDPGAWKPHAGTAWEFKRRVFQIIKVCTQIVVGAMPVGCPITGLPRQQRRFLVTQKAQGSDLGNGIFCAKRLGGAQGGGKPHAAVHALRPAAPANQTIESIEIARLGLPVGLDHGAGLHHVTCHKPRQRNVVAC